MTLSLGEWNAGATQTTTTTTTTTTTRITIAGRNGFFYERSFSQIMSPDDFTVNLNRWDEDEEEEENVTRGSQQDNVAQTST